MDQQDGRVALDAAIEAYEEAEQAMSHTTQISNYLRCLCILKIRETLMKETHHD